VARVKKGLPEKPDLTRMQQFVDELAGESDRGCALLASSWLENATKDLIRCGLFADSNGKELKEVFSGSGPFSSFFSCINVCYLSGRISKSERRALHFIRDIRNDFAHNDKLDLTFDEDAISNRCAELRNLPIFPDTTFSSDNKMFFCQASAKLIIFLAHIRRSQVVTPDEMLDPVWSG